MGEITEHNNNVLKKASSYEDAESHLQGMRDPDFVPDIDRIFDKYHITGNHIHDITGIAASTVNSLRSYSSSKGKNPSRKILINICVAGGFSVEDTNEVLKRLKYRELYSRDAQEAQLIFYIRQGLDYSEIRDRLYNNGFISDNLLIL